MSTFPSQVLIIRPGEKIGDPKKDNDGGRHLSIRGSGRAAALPSLFAPVLPQWGCALQHHAVDFIGSYLQVPIKGTASRFRAPDLIFATARSKDSKRPIETVTPLAAVLNVPINARFAEKDSDIKKMAEAIFAESACAGKIVLICWHHGQIPDIAKALGIARPPKWDAKTFDRVWQITFPRGKAALKDLPQMLLYGDSAK
jgi:hypothetical protein